MPVETQPSARVVIKQVIEKVFDEPWHITPSDIYQFPSVQVELGEKTIFQKDVHTHFWWPGIRKPLFQKRLKHAINTAQEITETINGV